MWKTRGHDDAVNLLKSSLAQDRISHAYLISGPEHVGKATLARDLAMALNCTAWQGEPQSSLFAGVEATPAAEPGPCYECAACRKALAGAYPDLQVFEQWTTERGSLTDQIRAIQYGSDLLPFEGRRKVYVLLDAHDLTAAAQNTLLKTLEEPAPTVCLVLTAMTPRALLPTVISRCQQIQLRAPSSHAIAEALIELKGTELEHARELAALAAGRMGWALDAVEDQTLLDVRREALEALAKSLSSGTVQRFRLAEVLAASPSDAVDGVLELWLSWLRDALLVAEGCPDRVVNRDQLEAIQMVATRVESREIRGAIRAAQAARRQVAGTINSRMALEVLMLRLPRLDRVDSAA